MAVSGRINRAILIGLLAAAGALAPARASAQLADTPWPMFHHDNRHTGRTDAFGTNIGKVKWVFPTDGPVTSSPAVDNNGIVYVGSTDNCFYAIDGNTGFLVWKYQTGGAISHSSPAIDQNGFVYIGSSDGHLYCFGTNTVDPDDPAWIDIRNPQPTWRFGISITSDLPVRRAAIESSAAIDKDGSIIFAGTDGYLYAVTSDGKLKWQSTYIGTTSAGPAIDTSLDPVQVYIGTFVDAGEKKDANFFALNTENGKIVWRYNMFFGGIAASPAIGSDSSVTIGTFTTDFDDIESVCPENYKYHMYNFSSTDQYTYTVMGLYDPDNWRKDGHDYCDEVRFRNQDGIGDYNWKLLQGGTVDIYATPALLGDNSFIIGTSNNLYRVMPDASTYYDYGLDGIRIESSPAIDGRRYIFAGSTGGRFYCLHADRPEKKVVWMYPPENEVALDGEILSSPAIGGGEQRSIYVGASDGRVYAFYDGLKLSGTVYEATGSGDASTVPPLPGVKLVLSSEREGDEPAVAYSDNQGAYAFSVEPNYTYTITPEKTGFVFEPGSRTVLMRRSSVHYVDFEARIFTGAAVNGTVRDSSGSAVPDVLVSIIGEKGYNNSTTTDAAGGYQFDGLDPDTYTVTPTLTNYTFVPAELKVPVESTDDLDLSGNDFRCYAGDQVSVSGYVTKDDEPMQDVRVEIYDLLTGNAAVPAASTSIAGLFVFPGVSAGVYQVRPALGGYGFDPLFRTVAVLGSSVYDINFRAVTGYYIAGRVRGPSLPDGFAISLADSQGQAVASQPPDTGGKFVFMGLSPGRYTIGAAGDGYHAFPETQTVDIIDTSREEVNFVAYPVCPVVVLNYPSSGVSGDVITLYGINFGFTEPDETGSGVFFGSGEGASLTKAEVLFWSSVMITVVVPDVQGVVRTWVLTGGEACIDGPLITNFFICDEQSE